MIWILDDCNYDSLGVSLVLQDVSLSVGTGGCVKLLCLTNEEGIRL